MYDGGVVNSSEGRVTLTEISSNFEPNQTIFPISTFDNNWVILMSYEVLETFIFLKSIVNRILSSGISFRMIFLQLETSK